MTRTLVEETVKQWFKEKLTQELTHFNEERIEEGERLLELSEERIEELAEAFVDLDYSNLEDFFYNVIKWESL